MKKILEFLSGNVIGEIGKVIDNLFTTDEERLEAKNKIFKVIQEKELELQKMQTDIIIAEAKAFEELNVFRYFEDQSDFSRPPPDLDLDFTGLLPDDEPEDCLCIII